MAFATVSNFIVPREIYEKGQDRIVVKFDGKDKGDLGFVVLSADDLKQQSLKAVEDGTLLSRLFPISPQS